MNHEQQKAAQDRSRAREDARLDLTRGWYSTNQLLETVERLHQNGTYSVAYRDSYSRSVRGRSNA